MKIVVNNQYTYETGKIQVTLGETVILPTPSWLLDTNPPTWLGIVTALSSKYDGPCVEILGISESKLEVKEKKFNSTEIANLKKLRDSS